jgi:hypothetical protein
MHRNYIVKYYCQQQAVNDVSSGSPGDSTTDKTDRGLPLPANFMWGYSSEVIHTLSRQRLSDTCVLKRPGCALAGNEGYQIGHLSISESSKIVP